MLKRNHKSATLAALIFVASSVLAQDQTPPKLEPLPEPPPPPPGQEADPGLEPQVTIIKRGEDVFEEFRIKGRLYMVKVTPRVGKPYFLIDYKGDGTFTRQDYLDPGIRPPMWVIMEW